MIEQLNRAIQISDTSGAQEIFKTLLTEKSWQPWDLHRYLYPVVQQVLNPPFKNPHLAKMYAVNREIAAYLGNEEKVLLVQVETEEYARREKLTHIEPPAQLPRVADFADVERSIAGGSLRETAAAMAAYAGTYGAPELARRLLLLGSGYLESSLGHSISCTAFILLEMIRRKDQQPWPALVLLADYFRKGGFSTTPELRGTSFAADGEDYFLQLGRAVSGRGIKALHDPITLYAIERCRQLLSQQEYDHMLAMWAAMMGNKQEDLQQVEGTKAEALPDFAAFMQTFRRRDPGLVAGMLQAALPSQKGRSTSARYTARAVLELYDGSYNPHNLTGLGSTLWLAASFHHRPLIVINGWLQYLDYFFSEI